MYVNRVGDPEFRSLARVRATASQPGPHIDDI